MKTKNSEALCLGIDIGGTFIKIGLFDEEGNLRYRDTFPTDVTDSGKHIFDDIVAYVQGNAGLNSRRAEFYPIAGENLIGVGIGVPGAVDKDGIVNKCVNLGWGVINVKEILEERLHLPVYVGNDANMAALGEYWVANYEKKLYSSALFVTLGTGVGGGIIFDGTPLVGANGAAAEIGHLPIVWDETEYCNCGKRGCLEQVGSANGVVRTALRMLKESTEPSVLRNFDSLTAKIVIDAAKDNDMLALRIVDRVTRFLGQGLACASCLVDPEIIIIGGGMSLAGEFLLKRIHESYREYAYHPCANTPIVLARLGNDAGIYGAAQLVLSHQ